MGAPIIYLLNVSNKHIWISMLTSEILTLPHRLEENRAYQTINQRVISKFYIFILSSWYSLPLMAIAKCEEKQPGEVAKKIVFTGSYREISNNSRPKNRGIKI